LSKKFTNEQYFELKNCHFFVQLFGDNFKNHNIGPRYLPHINSTDGGQARAAAERQAVNSTVQGSAADLVKKAMVDIERRMSEAFPDSRKPIRHRKPETSYCREGAFLLLQLHDELIYEVGKFSFYFFSSKTLHPGGT
jgi:DNA polymerase I-like protein with 3'-5' exonuclease and polymerase domains